VPRGEDVSNAHQARRTGPAVDINLAAMPILTRRPSHRHRVMLRTDRIDPATTHPVMHQLHKIRPQRRPLILTKLTAWL
jgi:hypothetical protein